MGSDSIVNASVPPCAKDFGKKKRTNRLAKLKQCKLDARREQWLSQAKNKGSKEELNVVAGGGLLPLIYEHKGSMQKSEARTIGEETDGSSLHDSDVDSIVNSPGSSIMGGNDSRKDRPGSSCGSSISSSSSSGCCSGNFSEEEEDDGGLDDWEAVADALTADEKQKETNLEPPIEQEKPHVEPEVVHESRNKDGGVGMLKPEHKSAGPSAGATAVPNRRAWRADDAFRPQSLPNLAKQFSFPMNAERLCTRGSTPWTQHCSIIMQPSSCPICYEDLDLTDSSFLPCPCGFRLCLFCHKRILEADARCPGCRKQYDTGNGETAVIGGIMPIRLSRSVSMGMRS